MMTQIKGLGLWRIYISLVIKKLEFETKISTTDLEI